MFRTSRGARVRGDSGSGDTSRGQKAATGAPPPTGYATQAGSPPASPPPPWGPPPQPTGSATGQVATGQVEAGRGGAGTAAGTEAAKKPRLSLAGSVYAGLAVILIILVIVIVLILQNLEEATIHLFTAHFRLPVGILVLLGAIGGALVVLLISLFLHFRELHRARRRKAQAARSA